LTLSRVAPWPAGLHAYALYLRAQASTQTGDWDDVAAAAGPALRGPLPLEMRRHLRVLDAQAALHRTDLARLQVLAPSLGEDARVDDRTGRVVVEMARAALANGNPDLARVWLLDLLEARPAAAESGYVILTTTGAAGGPPGPEDELRLARFESRARPAKAMSRLDRLADTAGIEADIRAEAVVEMARIEQGAGRHTRCLQLLAARQASVAGTESEPELLRLRARSLCNTGAESRAIDVYRDLAQRFPEHPRADDALYEVGWRHEIRGDLRAAEAAFGLVATTFPRSSLGDDALLRQGLCALRSARLDDALAAFALLPARYPDSPLLARALYWRQWIYTSRGDSTVAQALRAQLAEAHPLSWFAVLASAGGAASTDSRQAAANLFDAAAASADAPPDGVALALRNHARYVEALQRVQESPLVGLPPRFDERARLWRFLVDSGLDIEAGWESQRLEKEYARTPGALLALLAGNYERGVHMGVIRASYQLGLLLEGKVDRELIEILRNPAPYSVSLAEAASRAGLSHATLLAVMRQESGFDPRVDSRAGARGLLQVMPAVGTRLAPQVGRDPFHIDDLYDPATNIAIGSTLLARELEGAKIGMPQALAAYNAGPDVAARWAARLQPHEPRELYADLAEYFETRTYIERVLGSAAAYRRIYGLQ
jgi:soluble lytic murein transglycosylase